MTRALESANLRMELEIANLQKYGRRKRRRAVKEPVADVEPGANGEPVANGESGNKQEGKEDIYGSFNINYSGHIGCDYRGSGLYYDKG